VAVLSAATSSQCASSSPDDRDPTTISPSGSSVLRRPSLKTASSTRVSASTDLSTPKTSASFHTGLAVWRFVVVFLRFRRTLDAGLPLPPPLPLPHDHRHPHQRTYNEPANLALLSISKLSHKKTIKDRRNFELITN